ncbi:MAG: ABC transporter permease, partial [Paracoccaceae bacterium]
MTTLLLLGALIWAAAWAVNIRMARREKAWPWVRFAVPAIFGVTLLIMWEIFVAAFDVSPVLLPPPSAIGARIAASTPILWVDFLQTFKGVMAGYFIGCGVAFLTALAVDRSSFLQRGLLPIGNLFAALP